MKKKKTKKSNKNERIWDVEKIISETKQKEALLRQGKIAPGGKKTRSVYGLINFFSIFFTD